MKAIFGHVVCIDDLLSFGVTRIQIDLPSECHADVFELLQGRDVLVVTVDAQVGAYGVVESAQDAPEKKTFGAHYTALFRSGWFNSLDVARAMGSDSEYQAWCRRQPSAFSGEWSEMFDGEGRCEFAHVRRVSAGSGISEKPEYSGIPLTHIEHEAQHRIGESALGGKLFFEKKAAEYRKTWIKGVIHAHFGVESLADIDPKNFVSWINDIGVAKTLPSPLKVFL